MKAARPRQVGAWIVLAVLVANTGVDPITGGAVDRLIKKTRDTFGVTSVVVTHDIRSAYRMADRIAMLFQGKIIYEGPPDIFKSSDNPLVKQFVDGKAHGPIQVL